MHCEFPAETVCLHLQLTELNLERNKMNTEKVNLENQLEAEQEYILNKLHKQVTILCVHVPDFAIATASNTASKAKVHEPCKRMSSMQRPSIMTIGIVHSSSKSKQNIFLSYIHSVMCRCNVMICHKVSLVSLETY